MNEGVPIPQPDDIGENERDDAMGAYLMMFATWAVGLPLPLINLVASAIYFGVNARSSRFVAFNAFQSLTSQIFIAVINAIALAWIIAILAGGAIFPASFFTYLALAGILNILYLVFSVVAMVRARRGELYYIPFFGAQAFSKYYGEKATADWVRRRKTPVNRPPGALGD